MSAWWYGLPHAVASVTCGGESHRLRWAGGELEACDHDDLHGERTLAALGGERCTCADVLDAWVRHAADERLLVLASRGPADRLAVRGRWTKPAAGGWTRYAPMSAAQPPTPPTADEDLVSLLGLDGGIANRLVATVLATWTRRLGDADEACEAARPRLHASLHGRVVPAVRTWLGRPELRVVVHMADPGTPPALTSVDADTVRVELPFSWLSTVWARGLTTLMGRFCLDADTDDGRKWTLVAVDPDLGSPARIDVRL